MKTNLFLFILGLSMTACIHPTEIIQNKNLQIINGCEVPFSLGFVHGKTLKIEIETILQRWKTEVEKNYHVKFETVIQTFFENTTMLDTIKKYCPELLEEVRGIAEGSKQKFKLILALQMSEEIENAGDYLFSVVNLCRKLDIDPEDALQGANKKFIHRFSAVESKLKSENKEMTDASMDEMNGLWEEAKNEGK